MKDDKLVNMDTTGTMAILPTKMNSWEIIKKELTKGHAPNSVGYIIDINIAATLFVKLREILSDYKIAIKAFNKDKEIREAIMQRGEKLFEIRKNDRNFQVGNRIFLRETIHGCPTGNTQLLEITYVLQCGEYGLDKDYCILQLETEWLN